MNKLDTTPFPHDPTHDEIALCAFLLWEKEGRQPGREQTYWLQAEAQLRAARQQEIELLAAKAARPWPPAVTVPTAAKAARSRAITPASPRPTRMAPSSRTVTTAPVAAPKSAARRSVKLVSSAPARKSVARARA